MHNNVACWNWWTAQLRRLAVALTLCHLLFHSSASAATGGGTGAAGDPVVALKEYLSTEPSITRISFVEIPLASKRAPNRTYVAAYCPDGYYLRELKPGDDYLQPISLSNRMHSALFVGKYQDVSWQINGFSVGKSVNPNIGTPDPFAVFSQTAQAILEGTINLGSKHVKPGSFQWNGDEFTARPSAFMHQMQPELVSIRGKVIVRDGRVVEMQNYESGSWLYEYEDSTNRPGWFPAKIKHVGGPHYEIDEIWAVREIQFASPETVVKDLLPETHIVPQIALVTLYSNSTLIGAPKPDDPHVVDVVKREIGSAGQPRGGMGRRVLVTRLVLFGTAGAFLVALTYFTLRRGRPQ